MTVGLDQIIAINKAYVEKGVISQEDNAALEDGALFDKAYRLLKAVHPEAVKRRFQDAAGKDTAVIYDAGRYCAGDIAEEIARRRD